MWDEITCNITRSLWLVDLTIKALSAHHNSKWWWSSFTDCRNPWPCLALLEKHFSYGYSHTSLSTNDSSSCWWCSRLFYPNGTGRNDYNLSFVKTNSSSLSNIHLPLLSHLEKSSAMVIFKGEKKWKKCEAFLALLPALILNCVQANHIHLYLNDYQL